MTISPHATGPLKALHRDRPRILKRARRALKQHTFRNAGQLVRDLDLPDTQANRILAGYIFRVLGWRHWSKPNSRRITWYDPKKWEGDGH